MKENDNKTEFLFAWEEEFSIGIPEVDDQHRRLVGFVNELHRAIRSRQGRAVSLAILARLAEYTRTHFLFEESLMRVTDYPDTAKHKQQHDDLVEKVVILQDKLIKENVPITFELLHFLKNWLMHHICEDDKNFGLYFQRTSLKKNNVEEEDEDYDDDYDDYEEEPRRPWWKFWG